MKPVTKGVVLLLACLGAAGGCGASGDPRLGSPSTEAITSGEIEEGYTSVVALTRGGFAFCSGTLITPTVVMTAAHCLPPHAESIDDFDQILIAYATDVTNLREVSYVETGWTHPEFGARGLDNDIGLLRLKAPAPVTPIPPSFDPVEEEDELLVVGYGVTRTEGRDGGLRRSGLAVVDWVGLNTITLLPVPSNICFGDSGGASLLINGADVRVVGIHSHLGTQECGPVGVDERVDIHADEIRGFVLEATPTCAADHGCVPGCAVPDPDCDCGGDGVCSGDCPNGEPDPDCPDTCEADGLCVEACGPDDPDCPCSEDGRCDANCPDDPDCPGPSEPCSQDGYCDETCEEDADCRLVVRADSGGCSLTGTPGRAPWPLGVLSLLGLVGARLRGRRRALD